LDLHLTTVAAAAAALVKEADLFILTMHLEPKAETVCFRRSMEPVIYTPEAAEAPVITVQDQQEPAV
jgi:hypothetical protein